MHRIILILLLSLWYGCSGLQIPESTEDPNDPNRSPILVTAGTLEYPYHGRANLEGLVEVELTIDTSGTVTKADVLRRKFNADAVLTAAGKTVNIKDIIDSPITAFYKQCKYLPAMKDGKPVQCNLRTTMIYRLVK